MFLKLLLIVKEKVERQLQILEMNNLYFLIIFILLSFLFSCNNKLEGVDKKGFKYEVEVINDSIRHGNYVNYYSDGNTREKRLYVNGKLDGEQFRFYKNKNLHVLTNYQNGVKNGIYKVFYKNRILAERANH